MHGLADKRYRCRRQIVTRLWLAVDDHTLETLLTFDFTHDILKRYSQGRWPQPKSARRRPGVIPAQFGARPPSE
jgi:hypothetical protein